LILKRSNELFNGLPLQQWIKYETGHNIQEYARKMRNGAWGGAVETQILADYLKRPIGIYKLNGSSANLITEVMPMGDQCGLVNRPVFLLFNGHNHYDALV
jgi:hypothetical protein